MAAITAAELVWRLPAVVNDTTTNGGRMTGTAITTAAKNNIFPDVSQAERAAGSTKYRKVFIHVSNDDETDLQQPKVFVETQTPGDDSVAIFAGTQRDTDATKNNTDLYGAGQLDVSLSGGESAVDVLVEFGQDGVTPLVLFRAGETIRISDKTDVNDVVGNEEFHTILSVTGPVGSVYTVNLDGTTVGNAYVNTATRVASLYEPATVTSVIGNLGGSYTGTVTIGNGTTDHIGTVEQDWTVTFTDATNFTVVGDVVGAVGGGDVGTTFSPNNPSHTKPYFNLPPSFWGGTFTASDTVTFTTNPASIPVWYQRMVPAGASSLTGNKVIVAVDGESAS